MAGSYNLVDKIKNKLDFSKRNGITATGEPADEIVVFGASGVNSVVKEEKEKHAVFTFGRFNPPTTGHQKLIDAVKNTAETQGAEHHIFASHSQDKAKNPLGYDEKVGFMKKMYPKTNIHSSHTVKNVLDAAKHLQARGVTHGTLVVGSDRVDEFHNLLSKYNKHPSDPDYDPKKHFHIPHLNVVSAGHRDPDAEGVEGMSASKLRAHASSGNFKEFSKGVPNPSQAKPLYDTLRNRMGIKEELELTLEQQMRSRLNPTDNPVARASHKLDVADAKNQKSLDAHRNASIIASRKEDQYGKNISKKASYNPKPTEGLSADLTSHPYEETIMKEEKHAVISDNGPMYSGKKRHTVIFINKDRETAMANAKRLNGGVRNRFKVIKHSDYKAGSRNFINDTSEERIPTPFQRDELAPGNKPVDIGMSTNLKGQGDDTQLKRRKSFKLFRSYVEGTDGDAFGDVKPDASNSSQLATPVTSTPLQSVKAPKQRIKNTNPVSEEADDESGMAKNQLDTVVRSAKELKAKIKDKKDLPAWVQSKITKGEDQIDTVADYMKSEEKHGLWYNIHAKQERIKHGSGEHMRKPGSKGAPTSADFKSAQEEVEHLEERGADSNGYFRPTEKGAGLTKKGVAHFRAANPGSKLQTAVTGKVKPGSKDANRRKSFCARMSGMPGPMKDEKGRPTRKAMSLRRWRCRT
jgi:hypothetical protein